MAHRILFIFIIVIIAALNPKWVGTHAAIAQDNPKGTLSLIIAPTVLPADEATHSVAYLQLRGADGTPVMASQITAVSLSSSNRAIVNVPDSVNILAGKSYVVIPLTTSSIPGSATITAVAPNLNSVTASLETSSLLGAVPPLRLVLYASPRKMLAGSQPHGRLNVVLLGVNGRLAPATTDVNVVLTSSDPDVVRLIGRVTISEGSSFVSTNLEPMAIGVATLSAASSGFISDSTLVQVVDPGQSAEALVLHLSPPILASGAGNHPGMVIQAIDSSGTPVYFPCTQIFLASSSPDSVDIDSEADTICDQEVQFVEGLLNIGDLPGTATISAVATGMRPGSATLEIQGRVPFKLIAFLAPSKPMAAEDVPGAIIVQVQDANGAPVRLHHGITIKLVGSDSVLQEEMTIPDGQSYAAIELQGKQSVSRINLSLVSPGLTSANLPVSFQLLPITAEVILASAGPIFPGDQSDIMVRVRSGANPLPQASLTWSATGGTLGLSETILETDENGEGHVILTAQSPGDVLVKVTVSKPGYLETESQATVSVVALLETNNSSPGLFGIPILLLFVLLSVSLLGYLGFRYWPAIKPRLRIGTSDNSSDDHD